jgi:hypothetical protein
VLGRYLGCVDLNDLTASDQVQHAFLIGLAALLADSVYNIGELVSEISREYIMVPDQMGDKRHNTSHLGAGST